MTQTAIVGNTGSGKSYAAVEVMLEEIKKGRKIVTNIPLINLEPSQQGLIYLWDWSYLLGNPDGLEYPKGALYVLDECWRAIPSGLKTNQLPVDLLQFFKEHRHQVDENGKSNDIILITQTLGDICVAVRDLCKETTICDKPSDIGQDNVSVRYIHRGAIKGLNPVNSALITTQTIKLKPEVYQYYKSHTLSESANLGAVEGTVKSTVFTSLRFKGYLLLLVLALIFGGWAISYIFGHTIPKYAPDKPKVIEQPVSVTPQPAAPSPVKKPAEPKKKLIYELPESKTWRVSGVFTYNGVNVVCLSNATRTCRRIMLDKCRNEGGQLECEYRGELVASWTGKKEEVTQVGLLQGGAESLQAQAPGMPLQSELEIEKQIKAMNSSVN